MINPMDLSGKKILITGASSGIGKQIAKTSANLGAEVILVARNEQKIMTVAHEIGSNVLDFYCDDLSLTDRIEPLISKICAEHGRLDGLVHAAGVASNRAIATFTYERVHEIMSINFYAFFELVRVITKKGRFNEELSIVGVSSIASIKGNSAQTAYAASKAAMDGAMRCFAKELHTKKIRVNTVLPSMINTEMYEAYARKSGVGDYQILDRQYLGIGETEDVANAVSFLLSGASRFITGTQLIVDGGYTSS